MKKALVLSGGGAHGAYQVGVLSILAKQDNFGYDIVSGVSVGSINALQIALHAKENQKEAVQMLEKLWREEIKGSKSVYKPWFFKPFNYIASLWKGSLYSTRPLKKIISKHFNLEKLKNSNVDLLVGACCLESGEYFCATEKNEEMLEWIMASSAMPILFEPVKIGGKRWIDGGVRNVTPVSDILKKYDNVEEIDIILADPLKEKEKNDNFNSVINVATRSLETLVNEVMKNDIEYAYELASKKSIKIRIFIPNNFLNYDSFDFSSQKLIQAIELAKIETESKLISM